MDRENVKFAWMDGAAVLLSALCMLHCLALPLMVAGLPLLAQFSESHLHLQMLVIIVPLSVIALGLGFRHHRITGVLWLGFAGLMFLFFGATVAHEVYGEAVDRVATILGSVILAVAHYINFKGTRAPMPEGTPESRA